MTRRSPVAKRLILALTLLLVGTMLAPANASNHELYVAPGGSDSASGTAQSPFQTLSHALRRLQPGDTLYVRGGTYRERIRDVTMPSASSGSPTRVMAYPGEKPVVRGLLWIQGGSHWIIDGIDVTWDADSGGSSEHMVKLTNGTDWVFRNGEISGARSFAGMLIAGTRNGEPARWELSGNCLRDTVPSNSTNQDHNLYVNSGLSAGPGLIEGNVFTGAPNGENIKLGPPSSSGGSANVTIRHNTLHDAAQNVLISGQSHNILIESNILGPAGPGYGTVRGYEITGSNNVARNNIAYGASSLINNYNGGNGVSDGGDNRFPLDPGFDGGGCDGLNPTDGQAQGHGHTAATTDPTPTAEPVDDGSNHSGTSVEDRDSRGFQDVDGNLHEPAISSLQELGVVNGFSDSEFGPDRPVTRAQVASMISRTLDLGTVQPPEVADTVSFADVGAAPHGPHIHSLARQGILQGTSPASFSPDAQMTRAQLATVLVRAYEATTGTRVPDGPSFEDTSDSVHADNIHRAAHLELAEGLDGRTFDPQTPVRRDQLASMVHRYHRLVENDG